MRDERVLREQANELARSLRIDSTP